MFSVAVAVILINVVLSQPNRIPASSSKSVRFPFESDERSPTAKWSIPPGPETTLNLRALQKISPRVKLSRPPRPGGTTLNIPALLRFSDKSLKAGPSPKSNYSGLSHLPKSRTRIHSGSPTAKWSIPPGPETTLNLRALQKISPRVKLSRPSRPGGTTLNIPGLLRFSDKSLKAGPSPKSNYSGLSHLPKSRTRIHSGSPTAKWSIPPGPETTLNLRALQKISPRVKLSRPSRPGGTTLNIPGLLRFSDKSLKAGPSPKSKYSGLSDDKVIHLSSSPKSKTRKRSSLRPSQIRASQSREMYSSKVGSEHPLRKRARVIERRSSVLFQSASVHEFAVTVLVMFLNHFNIM